MVLADMACSSRVNHDLVRRLGAKLLVPFKSNAAPAADDGSAWSDALQFFNSFPDVFNDEYHQRSNVESTTSSLEKEISRSGQVYRIRWPRQRDSVQNHCL